ncbi:hypothetical protein [Rhizobium sp. No.120]
MVQDRQNDTNGGRGKKQALAKIQHGRAHASARMNREKDQAPVVADPRNRLADGKIDPETKERKPKDA